MATVTKTGDWHYIAGNVRIAFVTVAFSSSYTTGGESFAAADVGMRVLKHVDVSDNNSRLLFDYDYTNSKIRAYYPSGGSASPAALANPIAVATGANTVVPAGATAVTSTAAQPALTITQPTVTVTGGQGREVAAATDLSTITGVRVFAVGV